MSLRMRFAVLLSVIVLLLALGGGAGAVLLARSDAARVSYDRHVAEVASTDRLRIAYLSQAAAARAFLLTGDETTLAGYEAGRTDQSELEGQLRAGELTAKEVATLDRLSRGADRWRTEAIEPLIALRRAGDVEAVVTRYRDVDSFGRFMAIEDELDSLVSQFSAEAGESDSTADEARRHAAWVGFGLLLLAVTLTATATIAIRRSVTGPLAALATSVRGVQGGDLDTEIITSGPPELAVLGREIEQMRERICRGTRGLAPFPGRSCAKRGRADVGPEQARVSARAHAVGLVGVRQSQAGDRGGSRRLLRHRLGPAVATGRGRGRRSRPWRRISGCRPADQGTAASSPSHLRRPRRRRAMGQPAARRSRARHVRHRLRGDHRHRERVGGVRRRRAPPALLCVSGTVNELAPTGPIIGPFEAAWHSEHATIEDGQTLVVYTDGLIEGRDQDRMEFGLDRLQELVCDEFDSAEAVIKRCLDETAAFSSDRAQDDVTLVVVCRAGASRMPERSNG